MTKLTVQHTLLSEVEVEVSNKVAASLKSRSNQKRGKAVDAVLSMASAECQTKKPMPEWCSTLIMDQSGTELFEV